MSTLRPLGNRILIEPDPPDTETASGLLLPDDRDHVPVSGTVIAVGLGPKRDQKIRLACISRCMAIVEELASMAICDPQDYIAELGRYRDTIERFEPSIHVGDRVVYPLEAGLTVTEDNRTLITMNEDEVAILVAEEQAA